MLIKLSRKYLGLEIIEAFKVASTFSERFGVRWEGLEFVDKFQYKPGHVIKQTIQSSGVHVCDSLLKKRWVLFGKKIWKRYGNPMFTMTPLVHSRRYNEVEVRWNYEIREYTRLRFEKILGCFYAHLQP